MEPLKPNPADINEKGATAKGFSRKTKAVVALPLLLLCFCLAFIGLEAYSRLSERWSERHNIYITGRAQSKQPMPTNLPIVLDGCRWDVHAPVNPPSEASVPSADCFGSAWRECFESLGPMQRHLAAGRHDALVLEFDKAGNLLETFGFPTGKESIRRAERGLTGFLCKMALDASGFNTGVSEALHGAGNTKPFTLPMLGVLFNADFQPVPATGGAFAFFPNIVGGASPKEALPPDSPWQVPFFRYKKSVPNMRWGIPGTCHLNNVGFRGKDVQTPKPPGLYRIICLGGSTTEEGSSDDTTYPALLEKQLTAAFPGNPIEVVNCGISGMNTAAHLMRFADYLALEPDLILVYEGVNDAASDLPMQWLLFDSPFWVKAAFTNHFVRRNRDSLLYGTEEKLRDDVRTFTLDRFRIMREWAHANKADMVFCSIATPAFDDISAQDRQYLAYRASGLGLASAATYLKIIAAINQGLKELSIKEGWGYIPVAENFHLGLECFGDLCHMYPDGTERKAEIIFQCLKERLPALLSLRH